MNCSNQREEDEKITNIIYCVGRDSKWSSKYSSIVTDCDVYRRHYRKLLGWLVERLSGRTSVTGVLSLVCTGPAADG